MQLSNRLQAVANLVTPGFRVADIGCDHAYIAIYLTENNISSHVIAMDVNQGPLDRAAENIKKYQMNDRIEVRKSNGLQKLKVDEADTLLIAGMGGGLICEILAQKPEVLSQVKELVLQPQSDIQLVRKTICDNGFLITEENMLIEDGKYYVMMKAKVKSLVQDKLAFELTKKEHYYFGRLLLEQRNQVLLKYLEKEKHKCIDILDTLKSNPTNQSLLRQSEISDELKLIEQGFNYFNL